MRRVIIYGMAHLSNPLHFISLLILIIMIAIITTIAISALYLTIITSSIASASLQVSSRTPGQDGINSINASRVDLSRVLIAIMFPAALLSEAFPCARRQRLNSL